MVPIDHAVRRFLVEERTKASQVRELADRAITEGVESLIAEMPYLSGYSLRTHAKVARFVEAMNVTQLRYWTISYQHAEGGRTLTSSHLMTVRVARAQYEWAVRHHLSQIVVTEFMETITSAPVDLGAVLALPDDHKPTAPELDADTVTRFWEFEDAGPAVLPTPRHVRLAHKHLARTRHRLDLPLVLRSVVRVVTSRQITPDEIDPLT